jgi:hypothetical protein
MQLVIFPASQHDASPFLCLNDVRPFEASNPRKLTIAALGGKGNSAVVIAQRRDFRHPRQHGVD